MISFRDLISAFRKLEIDPTRPVIVHASLSAFGKVQGGAETVVGALLAAFGPVMMPAFTYKTMLIPEAGPPDNALLYGSRPDSNRLAEFFRPEMPVDRLIGAVAEALRRCPQARRSSHPILSFCGVNVDAALARQSLPDPLAPLADLVEREGSVLLLGVDHAVNTSIHYGERLAGRRSFTRWALTPAGVKACPGFPGCSDGFDALAPRLEGTTRRARVGPATIQAVPLPALMAAVVEALAEDPLALLCDRAYCERCSAQRAG